MMPDTEERPAYHVYPVAEETRHILKGVSCPCNPKVENYENGDVIIHNTKEQALKKAN